MLSIEQKAKAYDSIIEKANKMHHENCEACKACIEELISEIKESEDENTRNFIIKVFKDSQLDGISEPIMPEQYDKIFAWLEKHGKQKSFARYKVGDTIYYDSFGRLVSFVIANIVEDGTDNPMYEDKDGNSVFQNDIVEQKLVDKVELKFYEGDWIADKLGNTLYVKEVYDSFSKVIDKQYRTYNYDNQSMNENCHLWTIQDAKDGDVLAVENRPFIYNGKVNPLSVGGYCGITTNGLLKIYEERPGYGPKGWTMFDGDIYPATKEQRDTLMKAADDAGYTFDFEKKELKKIDPKTTAWTPMDEQHVENLLAIIEGHGYPGEVAWLNSLKDRVQSKQEWSKEDEKILNGVITNYESGYLPSVEKRDEIIEKLKSIKDRAFPQSKQKWGEEDKISFVF